MRKVGSDTSKIVTGCGNMYVTTTNDNDFSATLGKSGSCTKSFIEGTCKLVHIILSANAKIRRIDDMIKGGKIEIKGKEDKETIDRYMTRLNNMTSHEAVVGELEGIRCSSPALSEGVEVKSCMDGYARALRLHFDKEVK